MLPFMQPKKASSIIMMKAKPEGGMEVEKEEGEEDPSLLAAAEDIISAISMKDAVTLAMALKAAFEICDSMPHEEGPHIGEGEE
jgi:rRNA processing protein Krr1/Pno1